MLRLTHSYAAVFLPLWTPGISRFASLVTAVNRYLLFKLKFRKFSFSEHLKPNFSFISFFVCLISLRIVFNKVFYRCHCITKLFKSMGKMQYKRNANLHKPHCDLTLLELSVA